jgi:hypothetical protein
LTGREKRQMFSRSSIFMSWSRWPNLVIGIYFLSLALLPPALWPWPWSKLGHHCNPGVCCQSLRKPTWPPMPGPLGTSGPSHWTSVICIWCFPGEVHACL